MEGGRPLPGEAEGGGDAATTPIAPSETQLAHAWPRFLRGPEELHFASGVLLRQQLEEEMREVQNYVDHVRALTEARDTLATEYERENEELRAKFTQLQLEYESQHKEVAELLALEGLASIVHSSPSEQVAYLLVERSTLLERMEALEQELGASHCLGRPCAASLQVQDEQHCLEGAPDRLRSSQCGIPALKEDLDAAEGERGKLHDSAGAEIWQGTLDEEEEEEEEGAQSAVEPLAKPSLPREPLSALDPDSHAASELRKASEQNLLTDRLLLRDRLYSPEAERQASPGGLVASRGAASDLGGCVEHELHGYQSELLRLYGELRVLQGAAGEREFLYLAHEKLMHKNGQLEAKVLELSGECERLNQRILREGTEEEEEEGGVLASRLSCPRCPARGQGGEDQAPNEGGDGEPMCLRLSEGSKMGELQKPGQAKQEEEEEEEAPSFLKEHQLSAHRDPPCPPWAALGSPAGDTEQGAPHKGALQPQEEPPGTLWGPWQAPSSAKKQLRLEQERSLELRMQNLQLQQENLQVQAELRQAQVKVLEASKACGALASQGELSRQKAKELELQLLQHCQDAQQQSRLREQLAQESQRAAQAEERVQELEQGLQEGRQLWESQAALGRRQLEEEAREARAKEAEARRSLQEEQKRRKLLEQERRLWREEEARLLQALADRKAQAQQQEGQLRALEEERRALAQEQLESRSRSQRLSEELSALQREKEALCEEQRQMLKQVDLSLRKLSERRLRHKARLRQAKERLLGEVRLREDRIRQLEDELRLSKTQAEKDQWLIQRVTGENENLFREQRKSLEELHSLEEAKQSSGQALFALQSRVHLLEGENQQLQDGTLQLSLQVGILERALRTIHVHSLEELKSLGFPECPLQRKLLPFPGFSFSVSRLSDPSALRQALKEGPPGEPGPKALLCPPTLAFQSSLSLSGLRKPPADLRQDQPSHPVG